MNKFQLPQGEVVITAGPVKYDFMNSVMEFTELTVEIVIDNIPQKVKVRFTLAGAHTRNIRSWYGNIHILKSDTFEGEIRAYRYNSETKEIVILSREWIYSLIKK